MRRFKACFNSDHTDYHWWHQTAMSQCTGVHFCITAAKRIPLEGGKNVTLSFWRSENMTTLLKGNKKKHERSDIIQVLNKPPNVFGLENKGKWSNYELNFSFTSKLSVVHNLTKLLTNCVWLFSDCLCFLSRPSLFVAAFPDLSKNFGQYSVIITDRNGSQHNEDKTWIVISSANLTPILWLYDGIQIRFNSKSTHW